MWKDLAQPWQEAFILAWEAFQNRTIPIGAVIVDDNQQIIAKGRNMIFDQTSTNCLAGTYMAHAEMTAMMQVKESEHPNIRQYTLYTTLEPCPMCFGAMVMMNFRKLKFAARDGLAGATILNETMDYIKKKGMEIERASAELEAVQLTIKTVYFLEKQHPRNEELLAIWGADSPEGIALGRELHAEGYFQKARQEEVECAVVYDYIISRLKERV